MEKSQYEDGYFIRSLGAVANLPDVSMSELVANAWDAGASEVRITIPKELGQRIEIADDGIGITEEQFRNRWMKLGYQRLKHQSEWAEFPPERKDQKRRAYGRNGIGRHGLLCFSDQYTVETRQYNEKTGRRFTVRQSSGDSPFNLVAEEAVKRTIHGTTLWTVITRALPDPDDLRDSLAFRFLYDPGFKIILNGEAVTIDDHKIVASGSLKLHGNKKVSIRCIELDGSKRRKISHGVAFWVGGKLVGDPCWSLHGVTFLDGRTSVANKHLIIVQSDDLFNEVEPDWRSFKKSPLIEELAEGVQRSVDSLVGKLMSSRIKENKVQAIRENKDDIRKLKPLARIEVNEFVDQLVAEQPLLNVETLTAAVKAAVNLEKSRSGLALLEKLATLTLEDVEGMNRLLESWTVRDALAVLDELDRRMSVVKALEKVMADPKSDEVHTIHPLITHSRWLFGPEYDSPMYGSNVTIETAAKKVFKKQIDSTRIENPRQRPDLIFLKQSTVSFVGTEEFDAESTVVSLRSLLLIELKKGAAVIKLKHIQQAEQYVHDLLGCGLLDGSPFIHAFVVGNSVQEGLRSVVVGESPTVAKITPISFGQLVRTANQRLFRLQEIVAERYRRVPGAELIDRVLGELTQSTLFKNQPSKLKKKKKRASGSAR